MSGGSSTGSTFFDDFYDDEKRKKKYGVIENKPKAKEVQVDKKPVVEQTFLQKAKSTVDKVSTKVQDFLFGEPETPLQQKLPKVEGLKKAGFSDEQVNKFTLNSMQKLKDSETRMLTLREELAQTRRDNMTKTPKPKLVFTDAELAKSKGETESFLSKQRELSALEEEVQVYRQLTGQANTNKGFIKRFAEMFSTPEQVFTNIVPYVKSWVDSEENKRMKAIEVKLNTNTPLSDEEKAYTKRRDATIIQAYIDKGLGDVVAESIAPNTAYLLDFAITGGAYDMGKDITVKALTQAPKIVRSLAGGIVGSLAQGSIRVPSIAQRTSEYMLPKYNLVAGEKGDILIKKLNEGDSYKKALAKGYASTIVETASEHSGAIVEDSGSFIQKAILSRFGVLRNITKPEVLFNIAEKVGWNGIIPEVFEEYVQNWGQAIIDQTKIELPDPTNVVGRKDLQKALPQVFTDRAAEQFMVTAIGVAMQGSIMNISQATLNKALSAKERGDIQPIEIKVNENKADTQTDTKPKGVIPDIITQEFEKRGELSGLVNSLLTDQQRTAVEMIQAKTDPKEIMKEVGDNAYGAADKALSGEQGSISYLLDTYSASKEQDIKDKIKPALDKYFADNPQSEQMDMYKEVMGLNNREKPVLTPEMQAQMESIKAENAKHAETVTHTSEVPGSDTKNVQENTTEATSVLSYVDKNGEKVYTKVSPSELSVLRNETENIPDANGKESQIHLDAIKDNLKNGAREVSREEFIANHSQVAGVLDNVKTILEEGKVQDKGGDSLESQKEMMLKATIGKGEYKRGEVYYQDVAGGRRGVIIESVDNEGVHGYYLPTPSSSNIVGDNATLEPALFTKPKEELKITKGTDAKIRELLKQRFFPDDPVSKTPELTSGQPKASGERAPVSTPKQAAIQLIESYVKRGESIQSLKNGQMGEAGGDFSAQIGGYINGKKYSTDNILVTKLNGKEVNEVFSLKKIYDEILQSSKDTTLMVEGNLEGAGAIDEEDKKKKAKVPKETLKETVKETIITTNEQRSGDTNQLIGSEGVPDSQGMGEGSTGNTTKNTTVSGDEMASGGSDISSTSPGSGSATRIADSIQSIIDAYTSVDKVTGQVDIEKNITAEQAAILRAYQPAGGMESKGAEGRGLLDEYYTPQRVTDAIWKVLGKYITLNEDMRVLEPAAGIGRFVEGAYGKADIDALEINDTTARILKLLYPDTNVFNKQFETLFTTERGTQREVKEQYEVVVGNPPYGEHRGRYLGMGEEASIKKYEEYFIKRSLDLTKKDGIVAMLVPSGILRTTLSKSKERISALGDLVLAYRFPNGIFDTTEIGTDLLVFRKNTTSDETDIYNRTNRMSNDNYFAKNTGNVLGEETTKKGRFGEEKVVTGSLDEALDRLSRLEQIDIEIPTEQETTAPIVSNGTNPPTTTFTDETSAVEAEPRVVQEKVPPRKIDKKVTSTSLKKSTPLTLSNVSQADMNLWNNITATGELSQEYVRAQGITEPSKLDNADVNAYFENGQAQYFTNFMYQQGNIYEKLDNLEENKDRLSEKQYARQKKALETTLPPKMTVSDTQLQPTSAFIENVKFDMDGEPYGVKDLFERWMRTLDRAAYEDSSSYEVQGYIDGSRVNDGDKVRNTEIRQRRRRVGNKLFQRFVNTELTDDQKSVLEDRYNRAFNGMVRADYSKVPLFGKVHSTFKGKPLSVKAIQLEGAAFLSSKGVGLLGYDVGVGKTLTAIIALNESMKRGFTKRPLVIVPNATLRNWEKEIAEVIPGVQINHLENLGGKFKGDLKTFKVADGTISVMTYDGLTKLGFKPETYDRLLAGLQDTISGIGDKTEREIEREKAKADEYIGKAINKTSEEVTFEDLNFDHLTIDEVHNFKNIFVGAKVEKGKGNEYRNVHGSSSARGIKAYLMTQYILEQQQGRNVHLLSATPFTNSPLEIYSILSLMAKKKLENIGLKNVNEFMSMFMELTPKLVIKADQSTKEEEIIEKFINVQQLQKIVTEYIDFRTGDEAGVYRPTKVKKTPILYPTQTQVAMMKKAETLFLKTKDGGVIQGITEMQNIALSPHLSRYATNTAPEAPTDEDQTASFIQVNNDYKSFVEESPKIKATMDMIRQVKKDNGGVGQVIYMPRGVQFFPFVRQYLISELKYKSEEIGIVQGGMSIDAKQSAQDAFNAGKIKVLIGTEAIKEGVNLQENATDLYYLHLPWNPTDMLQVEGRIWRQGNKWKNVRIHYPLIENSVDAFIFQKLETKEKRIKNLWSYKGNTVEVGDLDFEEMKLDLITDPVRRVEAERSQTYTVEKQRLEVMKSDASFLERVDNKYKEAQSDLRYSELKLAEAQKTGDESDYEFYKKKVVKESATLSDIERSLVRKETTIEQVRSDILAKEKQIEAQETKIDGLEKVFDAKIETARQVKVEQGKTEKVNDFGALVSEIKKENETFFQSSTEKVVEKKTTGVKDEFKVGDVLDPQGKTNMEGKVTITAIEGNTLKMTDSNGKQYSGMQRSVVRDLVKGGSWKRVMKAPSGTASKSEYAITETPRNKTVEVLLSTDEEHYNKVSISAIEMPELVALAKEISGSTPIVTSLRGKYGDFTGPNRIRLSPEIFKNPAVAARVLAHEVGHLIDYLSAGTLSRGNIIGRIASLHKFLKGEFEDEHGVIKNYDIRKELKELTQMWAPFDESADDGYTSYRYSSRELYADAISVLFNDPSLLQTEAPKFWTAFFDRLNAKPDVRMQLEETWQLLMKGEEALLNDRDKAINDMFKKGDDKIIAKSLEERANKDNYWFKLKYDFVDRNQKVIDDIARAKKQGKQISDDDNPLYMLEEYNYVGGVIKSFVVDKIQPIYTKVKDAGIAWTDFGKALFLERVINERGEIANPLGQTPETATKQMAKLAETMGSETYAKLEKYIAEFREVTKAILEDAESSEFYSPELVKELKANPAYATFQVLDYLDTHIDARVKQQVGTLKEIANPADSTIQKTISLIRAIERNKTKRSVVQFYKKEFGAEIMDAKYMWTGTARLPVDPDDKAQGLITLYEKGKLRGYYVDQYIASTVGTQTAGQTNMALAALRFMNSKLYRPLFITFNTGFQTFNAVRDFTRFWKNTPNLPLYRAFIRYGQALKPAFMDAIDQPNNIIKEMEAQKILSVTANDVFSGQTDIDTQIDAIMSRWGTMTQKKKFTILAPINAVLNLIERTGNFIERLPKVAAYLELNGRMPSHELGQFVRTKAGSPDFLRRGSNYAWTNEVFLFSNAIKEGMRSDLQVATDPKTRGGFWFKTAMVSVLPKLLMFAALQGLFGPILKDMFEKVSEYDKTNYTIVPVGMDSTGKLIYVRIPQDETGRLIGAITWKGMRITKKDRDFLKDAQEIFSIGAGQFPSLSPSIGSAIAIAQFAFGQNPYDFFRNRNVIPDDAFKAGGSYKLKPFATWMFEQLGGGVLMKTYVTEQMPSSKSWQQKVLELPIISNVLGRWIKTSDYGEYEKTRELEVGIEQRKAQESIENKKIITQAVRTYTSGTKSLFRKQDIEKNLVKEIIGHRPTTTAEKTKATSITKKFRVAVVQGEYDTVVDRFFTAGTNEEKLVYLKEIKQGRSKAKFDKLIATLKKEKLISAPLLKEVRKLK
jgi:DNA-binding protein Fis